MEAEIAEIFGAALGSDGKTSDSGMDSVSVPSSSDEGARSEEGMARSVEPTPSMCRLAQYVMTQFRINVDHRKQSGIDEKLNAALLSQTCKYTPEQEEKMRMAGISPKMYSPVTSTKIRSAKSMLVDLTNAVDDPLFSVEPSPSPDGLEEVSDEVMSETFEELNTLFAGLAQSGVQELSPDAMLKLKQLVNMSVGNKYDAISNRVDAEARKRAKRMQRKVWDIMVEGGWNEAFRQYIDYICTYGTGIIIGPIPRTVSRNKCTRNKETGVKKYRRTSVRIPVFEAVNPQDCYPAPDALDVDDGPICFRVKYAGNRLWRYADGSTRGVSRSGDGWNGRIVMDLLRKFPEGGVKLSEEPTDTVRRDAENKGAENFKDCTYEGVRCFASVRGSLLIDMGIVKNRDGKRIDAVAFYRIEAIVIGGYVVYCRIYDDALGIPVCRGRFYDLPGSWWGECIADKLSMVQNIQNNVIKALLQNLSAASGPQFWVNDVSRLADKSAGALKFRALKTWAFNTSMMGNTGAPMGVLSVPSNAAELINVFKEMRTQADMDSGIPAFTEGQTQSQGGALRTASGLATFTEATNRGMKMVMTTTDKDVIIPCAKKVCDYILVEDDDMSLKGDVEVKPVGLIGRIMKAQRDQQRLQLFNMVVNNQFLLQLLGPKAVMALFRPSVQDVDVNPDDVIPSEDRIKEMELIDGIKRIFEATSASAGVHQNTADVQGEAKGATPGVQQPPQVQGGVSERRSVA